MRNSASGLKSLDKALTILMTFTNDTPLQHVSDVAYKLHMNESTVSRHLSTMLDLGFVERDNTTGCYSLGMNLITLAGVSLHGHDVYRHAYPEVMRLCSETSLHCFFGIPFNSEIIHLISIGTDDTFDLFTPIGHHHPMFCSAIGKAILAAMPPDEAHKILLQQPMVPFAPETVTDISLIEKELKKTNVRGYATISNELTAGKASLAAVVLNRNRQPIGAVSICGSLMQLDLPTREKELATYVMRAANRISGKMGYFPK